MIIGEGYGWGSSEECRGIWLLNIVGVKFSSSSFIIPVEGKLKL